MAVYVITHGLFGAKDKRRVENLQQPLDSWCTLLKASLKDSFDCMCMHVWRACMCMNNICAWHLLRTEEGTGSP